MMEIRRETVTIFMATAYRAFFWYCTYSRFITACLIVETLSIDFMHFPLDLPPSFCQRVFPPSSIAVNGDSLQKILFREPYTTSTEHEPVPFFYSLLCLNCERSSKGFVSHFPFVFFSTLLFSDWRE